MSSFDDQYLFFRSFNADTATTRLDVSGVSASVSLSPGGYVCHMALASGADHAFLRHGAAAAIPADGASGAGYIVPSGGSVTFMLSATTTMHAITDAGTARLYFVKAT